VAFDPSEENLEILQEFLQESQEMILKAEETLLGLEALAQSGGSRYKGALDQIFRLFHSIKGGSGFLELTVLAQVTHEAESYMDLFRTGVALVDAPAVDLLCQAVDLIKELLATVSEQQTDEPCRSLARSMVTLLQKASEALQRGDEEEPAQEETASLAEASLAEASLAEASLAEASLAEASLAEALLAEASLAEALLAEPPVALAPLAAEPVTIHEVAPPPRKAPSPPEPEGEVAVAGGGQAGEGTARVALSKLDMLMDLVGELIIAEAAVTHSPDLEGQMLEGFQKAAMHLNRITRSLQDVAMSMRMVPVRQTFRRMLRVVRDVAREVNKQVELILEGEDTEIDKSVVEGLTDPLVHIIRNAVDHGLETTAERLAANKLAQGVITLSATHQSGEVWIRIADDGKGLDRNKILTKARERGLVGAEGDQMSDRDVFDLLFMAGFSTAATVTKISGRGVGLDVVRRNIEQLGGRVDIDSVFGQGTAFTLRIPLTLAIIEGMLIRVGRSKYTLPLLSVRETVRIPPSALVRLPGGQEVVRIRDRILALVRLHELYSIQSDSARIQDGLLLVVESGGERYCLFVDDVIGQFQTVIKSLGPYFQDVPGISGCTILGNGEISLILDTAELRRLALPGARRSVMARAS
jgi:two-component system chemotaxis sensor kinase CheA